MRISEYLQGAWESVRPLYAMLATAVSYVIFPHQSYVPPTIALIGTLILDILTKYYAIAKAHGGLWNAIHQGHINSNRLWYGTSRKVISYFVVMVLAGLSYRVAPIHGIATFMTTFVYSIMFLREAQSSIENLIQAGHDLGWLLFWLKKKEENVMSAADKDLANKDDESKKNEDNIKNNK